MANEILPKIMKVGIYDNPFFFKYNRSESGSLKFYGGSTGEFLSLILMALNVEVEFIMDKDYFENGTLQKKFSGDILDLLEQGKVDFALGGLLLNKPHQLRSTLATHPYIQGNHIFSTLLPKVKDKTWLCFDIFNMPVWISIVVAIMMMSIFLFYVSRRRHSPADYLFSAVALLLQQGAQIKPSLKFLNRFLFANWAITAKFLGLFYGCVLLSIINAPRREPHIDTVDKLLKKIEEKKITASMHAFNKFVILPVLQNSPIPSNRKLGNYIYNQALYVINITDFKEVLEDDNCAVITEYSFLTKMDIEGKVAVSETFEPYFIAIYAKKDFCCLETLNRIVLRTLEGGLFKKMQDRLFLFDKGKKNIKKKIKSDFEEPEDIIKPLSLKDLKTCFVLYALGISLALLVFILELFSKKFLKK